MSECQSCSREWESAFLCDTCVDELAEMLTSLIDGGPLTRFCDYPVTAASEIMREEGSSPGLLQRLSEAAVGQVRLGEQGRWIRREPPGLSGDDHPVQLLPESEKEIGLEAARELRPMKLRRQYLASGRVNERASILADEIEHTLAVWAGGLARTHSSVLNAMNPMRPTAADYCRWLISNIQFVAKDEDAGCFFEDIKRYVKQVERLINRPLTLRECGFCPTVIDRGRHGRGECHTRLEAAPNAVEIVCKGCSVTWKVEHLRQRIWAQMDDWKLTRSEILRVLPAFHDVAEQPLPSGTLDTWLNRKKDGKPQLHAVGFRWSGDPVGVGHDHRSSTTDKPVYWLRDVKRLLAEKSERKASA